MTADTDRPARLRPDAPSQNWVAVAMLTVVTLLAFANGMPDALVFDDKAFVGPEAEQRLERLTEAFTRDVWSRPGFQGGLYRPLLLLDFEIESRLFGDWRPGYHVMNVLLHLVTTLLLFGFLRFLLNRFHARPEGATLAALAAALLFAVHPIHTEVVNSVFNRSSMFVTLLSVAGLWWLLSRLEKRAAAAWLGLGLCYSAAILFKESALVLPGIAFAFVFLLYPGSLWQRTRRGLPVFWLLLPVAVYFWARAQALDDGGAGQELADGDSLTAMFDTVWVADRQSLLAGIGLFGQGMRLLFWPHPLQLDHAFPGTVEIAVYSIAQLGIAALAVIRLLRGKPALAAGLAFYYLALLPSVRLFSLDGFYPHIAERYLYYPSAGLAIVLAFAAQGLRHRFGTRAVAVPALLATLLMAGACWDRNQEWHSEVYLFETEYQRGHRGGSALQLLVTAHRLDGRRDRVIEICDENRDRYDDLPLFVNACATSLLQAGRIDDAIAALERSAAQEATWINGHTGLARVYVALGERRKAAEHLAEIVNGVEAPEQKAFYQGEALLTLFARDPERLAQARAWYREALRIAPDFEPARQRLDELERIIQSVESDGDADSDPPR